MAAGILPGMGTTDARPRPFLTVEAKSVHGDFEEAKHPRDRHGRFISIGAHIDLGGGKKGEVTHVGAGSVTVKQDNGTSVTVKGDAIKNATVTKGPADGARAAAEAHAPDHASAPDHSPTDRSATPGTPDAKTGTDAVAALEDSVKRDLTPDERSALMDYVGGGYRKLNRSLRDGGSLTPDQQATTDTLQRLGQEHALHEPVVLYRGIDRDATVAFGDIGTAQGTEFADRGFGSTTLQADRASSWAGTLAQSRRNDSAVLQIHAPRGTPALPVEQLREGRSGIEHLRSRDRSTSGQFGSEEEVVLMPGARLRVTSDSEQDGHRVIVAEVVHDAAAPHAGAPESEAVPAAAHTPDAKAAPLSIFHGEDGRNTDLARLPDEGRQQILDAFHFEHPETGFRTEWNLDQSEASGKSVLMVGKIVNGDGEKIGRIMRTVNRRGPEEIVVSHDGLQIDKEYQGQGFADALYRHALDTYPRFGATAVELDANIDVGGYAWAQRGFEWRDEHTARRVSGDAADSLRRWLRSDASDALTPDQRERIMTLVDQLEANARRGQAPALSPKELANSLSDITWTYRTILGKEIKLWPGKQALLGQSWNGVLKLDPHTAN